jgi:hypothetical protein
MLVVFRFAAAIFVLLAAATGSFFYYRHRRRMLSLSYMVRFLTIQQQDALRLVTIPFDITVMADGQQAVRFAAIHRKRLLKILNAQVVSEFQAGSNDAELILHFLPARDPALQNFTVTVDGKVRSDKKAVISIMRDILMPTVKSNIVVHTASQACTPIQDQNFHVFLHSSALGDADRRQPNNIWHTPAPAEYRAFAPSGNGLPFMDEGTQFVVAELIEHCLYLHTDVLADSRDRCRNFLIQFFADLRWSSWSSPKMGLLVRILQHVKDELNADQYLADVIQKLKDDGLVVDATASERYKVSDSGFTGRRQEVIRSLVKDIILPASQCDVDVTHCHGGTRPPITDGNFHIFVQSSPSGAAFLDAPESLWGYRLLKKEKAFAPSALGLPIVDDSGFIVGELLNQNLYLHSEFIQFGTPVEAALLGRLLVEVRKELKDFATMTVADLERRVGRHFELECERQIVCGTVGDKVEVLKTQLRSTQDKLSQLMKAASIAQQDLYRAEARPGEEFGREFDTLLKIPKVTDVKVTRDHIVFSTETLNCLDPRDKVLHRIGAFDIHIPLNQTAAVVWQNKTQHIDGGQKGMSAPHVNAEGNACLGNTKDIFPLLIAKREFAAAIEVAIAFIESVNVTDVWGKHINRWPIADSAISHK